MLVTSQYTLKVSRPRLTAGPDDDPEANEGRAAIVPTFDRHGMAHPRVVRATRRMGLAPWFKRLQASGS